MKRSFLLTTMAAACCSTPTAAQLRGEGVEEVGEQIEHFPPEDYGYQIDRRILIADDEDLDMEARQVMEEYFDEFPDVDIMGEEVEDEPEFDPEWEDPETEGKEYQRDPEMGILVNTDLFGEPIEVDQYDRREAACGENQQEFKMVLGTDNYGYEISWALRNVNGNKIIARGPPSGRNYADAATYSGRWCLAPGRYQLQITDKAGDGICSGGVYGCGKVMTFLNGVNAGRAINDRSKWSKKNFPFVINPGSSRIDDVGNTSSGNDWCQKVRNVMKLPQGTCTLPNGQRGHRVRVTTKIDKYPLETSWAITRSGQVRMKMGPIIELANPTKSIEDCLPAGDYTIKFQDLDGICCRHGQGFFKVTVDGKELVNGGSFTKTISHDFKLGYDWISTMSPRDCEWWWAHDYRRRDWHTRCYGGKYCNKSYRHLKWSTALKQDAKVYANKLLSTCDDAGIKHDATDQGENLAKNKGSGQWGRQYEAELVTKRFVDNEEFWPWNKNAHLTQAMWYPSRYMGCAESVKDYGNGKVCRMQVCRYAKAGNCMMGKYNSEQGKNWMIPMMMDDSPCGPMCPPRDGCFH